MAADMSADAMRGRRQLIGIAAAVWLPPLARLMLDAGRFESRTLLSIAVPMVLLWGLVRGWGWARTWTSVSLGLGAVAATVGVLMADSLAHRFASGLTAVAWGLACGVLSKSESIDAYYDERRGEGASRA
jgi:hypothetical protein